MISLTRVLASIEVVWMIADTGFRRQRVGPLPTLLGQFVDWIPLSAKFRWSAATLRQERTFAHRPEADLPQAPLSSWRAASILMLRCETAAIVHRAWVLLRGGDW
jgi:hypothetical protein